MGAGGGEYRGSKGIFFVCFKTIICLIVTQPTKIKSEEIKDKKKVRNFFELCV